MMDGTAGPLPNHRRGTRAPRRQKTAMAVAQRIVEEISRHRYPPGTKLPAEREMLAQYEVGRGTLRESLRFLEMNGVLTVKPGPGGGPVVAAPDAHDLASTLGLFLELHGTRFGAILDVREVLEPALAAMAATRQDEIMIRTIGASVEAMAAHLSDLDLFLEENERFHELVSAAAGNPVFTLLTGSLDRITDGSRLGIDYPLRRRQAVLSAHRSILAAIAAGDADKSRDEMLRHMVAFRRYTDKYYPQAADSMLHWSDIAP
jgi:GntR family transcriptional regulator, transcriptional repressor for pyruvate dehydrogenase complex